MAAHDTDEIVINIILPENWQGAAVLSAPRLKRKDSHGNHLHLLFCGIKSKFHKTPSRSWAKKGISQSKGVWWKLVHHVYQPTRGI